MLNRMECERNGNEMLVGLADLISTQGLSISDLLQ